jgi:iron complex outermembrane receptor protein
VDSSAIQNTLIETEPTIPQGGGGVFNWFYNDCIAGIEHGVLCAPGAQNVRGAYDDNGNIVKSSDGRFDGVLVTPFFGVNVDDNPYNDRLPYDDRFVHPDIDKSYATGNSFDDMAAWGLGATLTWDISPTMEFKSITAYRKLDWIAGMDLDGSPLSMLHTSFEMIQDQFSQEFQLNGSAMDGKLNYTTGLYYFTEEGTLDDYVTFPAGFLQVYGPNDLKTDAYAVFANVDYALTDRLELSAGIRYTEEDKEFEGFQHDLNGSSYKLSGLYPVNETNRELLGFPNPGEPLRYFPKGVNEQSFDDVSPRLALRYSLTDDINIYGSWAEGYKTGSWTTRLSSPLSFAPDFGPEEAETWEIGIKGEFLDRKLRVNGAYFFTDYTGIQLNFQEGVSPTFKNAGDAEIQGLDMDITGYFGGGFSFTAGIGLIDAEYTRIDPGAGLPLNNDLPKVPDTQISFGPQYELDLGNGGGLRFNLDYLYQSELENTTENDPELVRPDIDMFNASVTYTAPDGSWDVVLGGTNLTDERYLVTGQAQRAGGQIYGSYNRPREYYLTVRWRN